LATSHIISPAKKKKKKQLFFFSPFSFFFFSLCQTAHHFPPQKKKKKSIDLIFSLVCFLPFSVSFHSETEMGIYSIFVPFLFENEIEITLTHAGGWAFVLS